MAKFSIPVFNEGEIGFARRFGHNLRENAPHRPLPCSFPTLTIITDRVLDKFCSNPI